MNLILIANWTPILYSVVNYVHYILAYLPAGSVVITSCALFDRIRGRPYCLHGGHGSLKITPDIIIYTLMTIIYTLMTPNYSSLSLQTASLTINHLLHVVNQNPSWMTSNLLCLNPSKTEFLLIGLREKLKKIPDPSISLNPDCFDSHIHSNFFCPQLRCKF